jgi:3-phenylpropionate/trans-cinnamate dioxygenase ferredoxin reductase subunit
VHVLVVGASLAGARTVQALRREGSDAPVTLVDAATEVACDRPPLSKKYLADPATSPVPVLTPDQLAALDVSLELGRRAEALDPVARTVDLDDGRSLPYDALVIATGSAPRTLPGVPDLAGVTTLRTATDAALIRAALTDGARVVVVGGGFVGAEVAWTARSLGRSATIVEPLPHLMARGLGPVLGDVFTRRHVAAGTDVRLGVGVASVDGGPGGSVSSVTLTDGSSVPADLVVIGVGTVPVTGWLAGSGLDVRDGVLCDDRLAAVGASDVYAAGDVARWNSARLGGPVRVEHWTNAVEHGPVVAKNITGTPTVYDAVPYVWSDQLGARLQIFGRVGPDDEVRFVHGGPDEPSFVAVTGDGTRLHAVVGYGAMKQLLPFRKLLLDGADWAAATGAAGVAA